MAAPTVAEDPDCKTVDQMIQKQLSGHTKEELLRAFAHNASSCSVVDCCCGTFSRLRLHATKHQPNDKWCPLISLFADLLKMHVAWCKTAYCGLDLCPALRATKPNNNRLDVTTTTLTSLYDSVVLVCMLGDGVHLKDLGGKEIALMNPSAIIVPKSFESEGTTTFSRDILLCLRDSTYLKLATDDDEGELETEFAKKLTTQALEETIPAPEVKEEEGVTGKEEEVTEEVRDEASEEPDCITVELRIQKQLSGHTKEELLRAFAHNASSCSVVDCCCGTVCRLRHHITTTKHQPHDEWCPLVSLFADLLKMHVAWCKTAYCGLDLCSALRAICPALRATKPNNKRLASMSLAESVVLVCMLGDGVHLKDLGGKEIAHMSAPAIILPKSYESEGTTTFSRDILICLQNPTYMKLARDGDEGEFETEFAKKLIIQAPEELQAPEVTVKEEEVTVKEEEVDEALDPPPSGLDVYKQESN